jgi:hypothetical protein
MVWVFKAQGTTGALSWPTKFLFLKKKTRFFEWSWQQRQVQLTVIPLSLSGYVWVPRLSKKNPSTPSIKERKNGLTKTREEMEEDKINRYPKAIDGKIEWP